ncbi:MAG: aldehyde-activating protein [Pseudomonadota bacterium]
MTSSCACGNVKIRIDRKPDFIYDCNCSLCRKTGGAWGYFTSEEVTAIGATVAFSRSDKASPIVEIHSCGLCGSTTHFLLTEAYKARHPEIDQIGVNMRLFDPELLSGVEIHYPDGKAWSGKGPFKFRRSKMTISSETPW